jgi:hypothetical protein
MSPYSSSINHYLIYVRYQNSKICILWHNRWKPEQFGRKWRLLLGYGTTRRDATLEERCSLRVRSASDKIQHYKSQSGFTQCYNCQQFGHVWANCRQPPRCLWCGGGHLHRECLEEGKEDSTPPCCNCKLGEGEKPHPSTYRGCSHAKEELRRKKIPRTPKPRTGRKSLLLQMHHVKHVLRGGSTEQGKPHSEKAIQARLQRQLQWPWTNQELQLDRNDSKQVSQHRLKL